MSKAINGEQAAELYIQGKFIQLLNIADDWVDVDENVKISYFRMCKDELVFREKPPFITVNGIEVPKSSDTYSGGLIWILCGTDTREYTSLALDENDELPAYFWRTEDEIKQVVSALRQVFGGSYDN